MSLVSLLDNDIEVILRDIISGMNIDFCITESIVIPNGNTFKLETCNTQYLRPFSIFGVNGKDYQVTEFVQDEYIIVMPLDGGPILTDCFTLRNPLYLVGSPMMTSIELTQLKSDLKRAPFIWLLEVFDTDYSPNSETNTTSVSNLMLFIFDFAKSQEWLNIDHRVKALRPMKSLTDLVIKAIEDDGRTDDLKRYKGKDRINFGSYADKRGDLKLILPEKLTGVELTIEIPIFTQQNCKKKLNCK